MQFEKRPEPTPLARLPLVLRFGGASDPVPLRPVRVPPRSRRVLAPVSVPDWVESGPEDQPFDFCGHIRALSADIARNCDELKHIDVSRILFGMTQARTGCSYGLQARVTPLRFKQGKLLRQRRGVCYQVQRYIVDGREMLYLVSFCLPRFLDQPFDDKFVTLFHELYHISPEFDGDLRRHGGRYSVHTHSKKEYDAHMARLATAYLSRCRDARLHHFMRLNFAQLQARHGGVISALVPRPKLVPVTLRPSPSPAEEAARNRKREA
jgi:hypothetical protein